MPRSVNVIRVSPVAVTLLASLLLAACGGTTPPVSPAPVPVTTPRPATPAETAAAPDTGLLAGIVTPELRAVDLDTVQASLFDQGKMWTFEFPPMDYLATEYGFRPDSSWFEKARLAALRLSNCSASFVSPHGLVMTNHHCARESTVYVSRPGEHLLDQGFFAHSLAEERPVAEDFHADQLIALVDVTAQVEARLSALSEQQRAAQRDDILQAVGDSIADARGGEQASIVVEVISLWDGGHYSAYVFHRYQNIKLVAVPELQIAFFGGDPDNFTYPRYNLDFSFFRVYGDDGRPLDTSQYFQWDTAGARPGEPTFVIGNPGSTSRLQTVAELEFRRDVSDLYLLEFLRSRIDVLQKFADSDRAAAERLDLVNTIFDLQNSEKAYEGQVNGLEDVGLLARRLKLQQAFRDSILSRPDLRTTYGSLLGELAQLQAQKRQVSSGYGAFFGLTGGGFSSATLHRALMAFQILNAGSRGAPAEALQGLRDELLGVQAQPAALDQALMAARFRDFIKYYGQDAAWLQQILQGRTPEAAAAAIQTASVLADSAGAAAALEGNTLTMQDPAVQVVTGYLQPLAHFQQVLSQAMGREQEIAAQLGRARLAVYGTALPPDATFSLRIADGVVKGYDYNGTLAPTHTTLYGLYDRYFSFRDSYRNDPASDPWALPPNWQRPPAGLNLATPLDFVTTADIIGGNSGSPVVDRDLRVVGLIFDGNIESLPGDYIYLPESNRSVAVDTRGIMEVLDNVYDMDRLVVELTSSRLPATEAEADRMRR